MKKLIAGLMIAASMLTFGCGGRNVDFGTVDTKKVYEEAPIVKTITEDFEKQKADLEVQMKKDLEGKSGEEVQKVYEDYSAKAQLIQSEAQNKLKASFEAATNQVAQEKKLGAILNKGAVAQGGTDVTKDIIEKMK